MWLITQKYKIMSYIDAGWQMEMQEHKKWQTVF